MSIYSQRSATKLLVQLAAALNNEGNCSSSESHTAGKVDPEVVDLDKNLNNYSDIIDLEKLIVGIPIWNRLIKNNGSSIKVFCN